MRALTLQVHPKGQKFEKRKRNYKSRPKNWPLVDTLEEEQTLSPAQQPAWPEGRDPISKRRRSRGRPKGGKSQPFKRTPPRSDGAGGTLKIRASKSVQGKKGRPET